MWLEVIDAMNNRGAGRRTALAPCGACATGGNAPCLLEAVDPIRSQNSPLTPCVPFKQILCLARHVCRHVPACAGVQPLSDQPVPCAQHVWQRPNTTPSGRSRHFSGQAGKMTKKECHRRPHICELGRNPRFPKKGPKMSKKDVPAGPALRADQNPQFKKKVPKITKKECRCHASPRLRPDRNPRFQKRCRKSPNKNVAAHPSSLRSHRCELIRTHDF